MLIPIGQVGPSTSEREMSAGPVRCLGSEHVTVGIATRDEHVTIAPYSFIVQC